MTELTSARLAELRGVAEAATEGPWESGVVLDDEGFTERVSVGTGTWIESGGASYRSADLIFETDTYGWDEDDCQQAADNARHVRTFDPPTVLALIAALDAKTAKVEGYRQRFPCDGGCNYNDGPQEECSLHGRNPSEMWEAIGGLVRERDEARAEVEELRAWQAQTVRRVRDTVASEHLTMLVVEDIPNADYGELIDTLAEQRDEARAEVEALDREVWRMRALRTEASADRTLEMVEQQRDKADRRADRAEAAIERVREAATEVANRGDNLGGTHYENCWKYHLHCLAAKIIYETEEETGA